MLEGARSSLNRNDTKCCDLSEVLKIKDKIDFWKWNVHGTY